MPFQSEKQRRFMWARHPDIARRWTAEYGSTPMNRAIGSEKFQRYEDGSVRLPTRVIDAETKRARRPRR